MRQQSLLYKNSNSIHANVDTLKQKEQMVKAIKKSEQLWNFEQGRQKQSLKLLKKGILLLQHIILYEKIQKNRNAYADKLIELKKRLDDRQSIQRNKRQEYSGISGRHRGTFLSNSHKAGPFPYIIPQLSQSSIPLNSTNVISQQQIISSFIKQNKDYNDKSSSYRQDTLKWKEELMIIENKAQSQWKQKNYSFSLIFLKQCISILENIVKEEELISIKAIYNAKLIELKEKLKERLSLHNNLETLPNSINQIYVHEQSVNQPYDKLQNVINTKKQDIKWEYIQGLVNQKRFLEETIIFLFKYPSLYKNIHKRMKGVLLYGYSGFGKTYLAKSCANCTPCPFFSINMEDIVKKKIKESEKIILELFQKAISQKPSIIMIDQIQILSSIMIEQQSYGLEKARSQFLIQMCLNREDSDVTIIGITNKPWKLDQSILLKFQKKFQIVFDYQTRLGLIRSKMKSISNNLSNDNFTQIATKTDKFNVYDIDRLISAARSQTVKRIHTNNKFQNIDNRIIDFRQGGDDIGKACILQEKISLGPVELSDFLLALKERKPSLSFSTGKLFQLFKEKHINK